jgi:nitroimidazol reductase NimA-like FMN-containing flavoprotein (pyridoxamine 5'-phosphate oxidase superfamily)
VKNFEDAPKMLITENLKKFLLNKEFVSVGTADLNCKPNAAPKYIIKIEGDFIYLADYVKGHTFQNLKVNPRISLSATDMKTLEGWQINGIVRIITAGPQYKKLSKTMIDMEVRNTARRIIEDVQGIQKHDFHEVSFPKKVVIFKIKCEKLTKIGITGKLQVKRIKR